MNDFKIWLTVAVFLAFIVGMIFGSIYYKSKAPLCQDAFGLKRNEVIICKQVGD